MSRLSEYTELLRRDPEYIIRCLRRAAWHTDKNDAPCSAGITRLVADAIEETVAARVQEPPDAPRGEE
jgi:hypothetical protein